MLILLPAYLIKVYLLLKFCKEIILYDLKIQNQKVIDCSEGNSQEKKEKSFY